MRAIATLPFLVTAFAFSACAPAGEPRSPNIVLLVSDDHDYEQLGFLGLHEDVRTPALDRLAAEGVVLPVAHNASRCRPTLAGLLSGRHPHQSGIHANVVSASLSPAVTLPALLRDAGYATFAQGKLWEGDPRRLGFTHGAGRDPGFVRNGQEPVRRFLDEVGDTPFFLWWAPELPHLPHDAPQRFRTAFDPSALRVPNYVAAVDRERYREREAASLAMVSWLDAEIHELVQELRRRDLLDDTLVVFLIDNGWANGLPSKGSAFEKGLRTPLVFHFPGRIGPGRVVEALASTLDVMPTVLDYAGVAIPEHCAGRSLRPLLEDEPVETRDALYGALYPRVATGSASDDVFALYARTPRWKYVLYHREPRPDAHFRIHHVLAPFPARVAGDQDLFDLEQDPYEQNDLADDPAQAERLAAMREGALQWWRDTGGGALPLYDSSRAPSVE